MERRPTFDQIQYAPDLGERLTLVQAEAFRRRFYVALMQLGRLVLDELRERKVDVAQPEDPIDIFTTRELVQWCGPRQPDRGIYVGQVSFRMSSGSTMPIALMVEWDTEDLVVFWGLLKPEPVWKRLSDS